jgi:hypothetical protein
MGVGTNLQRGFSNVISKAGTPIKIDYFNIVYDNVYDDVEDLIISGTLWTSGVILALNRVESSTDFVLMEQGLLADSDRKLYVNGSLGLVGSEVSVKIQIGSPTGDTYTTIPNGAITHEVEGLPIYKKVYLRRLTGSLLGE